MMRRLLTRLSTLRPCALATLAALAMAGSVGAAPTVAAQAVADTVTQFYNLDGLRVLHHKTNRPVFSVRLYLLGGSRQLTRQTAGVEPMYLIASDFGTTEYPGDEARRARARTGASVGFAATRDYTVFSGDGLREDFDSTFTLMASRLMHPTLDETAMTVARTRLLIAARSVLNSPEAQSAVVAESIAFLDHPYALDPYGSVASLEALTADDLRAYAQAQLVKSRMLLVVVGDVSRERVDALIAKTLGTLPAGTYLWSVPAAITGTAPRVVGVQRGITTNYLWGYFHGPSISSPEYPAFEISMGVLSSYVGFVLRDIGGLTYSAGVTVYGQGAAGAAIYVSTTRPDSAMRMINALLDGYSDQFAVSRRALRDVADNARDTYLLGMETAAGHASMLALAQLYNGDYRAAARQWEVMRGVSATDMRRAARFYAKNIQWGFVGDTLRIPREDIAKRK